MPEDQKKKSWNRHLDRITLEAGSLEKLDGWIKQVCGRKKGVSLSRKEAVNWLISKSPGTLSVDDHAAITEEFFDELRFLQASLKELRQARAQGESLSLEAVLG